MHKIFIGYDERQPVSYTVLQQSIIAQTSEPVAIIPLKLDTLPIKRKGLTPFTYSRFLVPHLSNYEGWALFLDVDIALNADISELFKLADNTKAIMVSKNEHKFEWASVMLFNCAHPSNKVLTPEYVEKAEDMHRIGWLKPEEIGDLPREWNHLVGYDEPREVRITAQSLNESPAEIILNGPPVHREDAKLVHYTQGVPAYQETSASEYGELWNNHFRRAMHTQPWAELMGPSIHAVMVNDRPLPVFMFDLEKQCPKPQYESLVKRLLAA